MAHLFQATRILPIFLACASFCLADLNDIYEWKYVDYDWESNSQRQGAIDRGLYNYTKIITDDVQPLKDGRILVTTPRYYNNPASLSTISTETGEGGPLLAPYPGWSWHNRTDCSGITSVNDLILDDFNRLWLVDAGKIENEQVCQAKILVFDPDTDQLLLTVEIPDELSHNPNDTSKGRLSISAVETYDGDSFNNTWAYIADIDGFALLVWNGSAIWRLDDDVFSPTSSEFIIADQNVTLNLGPSHSIITDPGYVEDRALLFKPTSGEKALGVSLNDLHNSWKGSGVTYWRSQFTEPSQETARIFSKIPGLFVGGFATQTGIACFNLQNTLAAEYIVFLAINGTNLQFVSGIKDSYTYSDDDDTESHTLWVTSNRLQKFVAGTVDFTEINFRILTANLTALVEGTVCAPGNVTEVATLEDKLFDIYSSS